MCVFAGMCLLAYCVHMIQTHTHTHIHTHYIFPQLDLRLQTSEGGPLGPSLNYDIQRSDDNILVVRCPHVPAKCVWSCSARTHEARHVDAVLKRHKPDMFWRVRAYHALATWMHASAPFE
jgi:hypothetical protein